MGKQRVPYGTWPSPISSSLVAGKSVRFGLVRGDGRWIYWSESRPDEGGRNVLMRTSLEAGGGNPDGEDLIAAPFSARSKVHEYGGGEFSIENGQLAFVNGDDQDIYTLMPDQDERDPVRLTNLPTYRFADMCFDTGRGRLIAIAEEHKTSGDTVENSLVAIALDGDDRGRLAALDIDHDFYAAPMVSPDGRQLAWMAWDLPDMPWDQAGLYVSSFNDDGSIGKPQCIAGADGTAVLQPLWLSDGRLAFISDQSGYGQLYIYDGAEINLLAEIEGDLMRPLWGLGARCFDEIANGTIRASYLVQGAARLVTINCSGDTVSVQTQRLQPGIQSVEMVCGVQDGVAAIVGDDLAPPSIAVIRPDGSVNNVRSSGRLDVAGEGISRGRVICIGDDPETVVYGIYYPPMNVEYSGLDGEVPPAIILVHGGPTGSADRGLKLKIQFWTSRGFAVLDLDYSGSTGYGRAYRERLDGNWGLRDVADVNLAAAYLVQQGLGDERRLFISGGSAGGYTVLMCLAGKTRFAAAGCYYGVSDLEQLLKFTHKFESGYLYRLMGTDPDNRHDVFAARSPLNCADAITTPIVFFQGLEDFVVPPDQSRTIVSALRQRGVDVQFVEFEGEGHGFRRSENIQAALDAEYAFFKERLA